MSFYDGEEALVHYGVKGMRWGVRRDLDSSPRITRRENRRLNREAEQEFYDQKTKTILKESLKGGDKVLIKTRYQGDPYQTITTGKEFAKNLANRRAFDPRDTEVFARQKKAGEQFVQNIDYIGTYKTQNFRKR